MVVGEKTENSQILVVGEQKRALLVSLYYVVSIFFLNFC